MPEIIKDLWDDQDEKFRLRHRTAQLVASMTSGLDPDDIVPEQADYDYADDLKKRIEADYRG